MKKNQNRSFQMQESLIVQDTELCCLSSWGTVSVKVCSHCTFYPFCYILSYATGEALLSDLL